MLGKNKTSCMDHMGGFDQSLNCAVLNELHKLSTSETAVVETEYIFTDTIKTKYDHLDLKFNVGLWTKGNAVTSFDQYNIHPTIQYKNFICSFNGTPHVGRKLLVSILQKFGYFNQEYCSKNFSYSINTLDGHIADYKPDDITFSRKFFISDNSEDFFQTINTFGHVQFQHDKNIYNLESKLTESFLHIVSETMATSYYPFVTEKFLYSIVTRGLFLAYAQPGWHRHLEKYYGFKPYTKLFDYRFDTIQNPIDRLIELMTMISKFDKLTPVEWHDLYLLEQETIEYNYDHYFGGGYLKHLKKYCD
jgi:hypothetical protein